MHKKTYRDVLNTHIQITKHMLSSDMLFEFQESISDFVFGLWSITRCALGFIIAFVMTVTMPLSAFLIWIMHICVYYWVQVLK